MVNSLGSVFLILKHNSYKLIIEVIASDTRLAEDIFFYSSGKITVIISLFSFKFSSLILIVSFSMSFANLGR